MSNTKSKFAAFMAFIGLSELVLNNNEATVTLEQLTNANEALQDVQKENQDLGLQNQQLSEQLEEAMKKNTTLEASIAEKDTKISELETEVTTLKEQPGSEPSKAPTNKDGGSPSGDVNATKEDASLMENLHAIGEAYSGILN